MWRSGYVGVIMCLYERPFADQSPAPGKVNGLHRGGSSLRTIHCGPPADRIPPVSISASSEILTGSRQCPLWATFRPTSGRKRGNLHATRYHVGTVFPLDGTHLIRSPGGAPLTRVNKKNVTGWTKREPPIGSHQRRFGGRPPPPCRVRIGCGKSAKSAKVCRTLQS